MDPCCLDPYCRTVPYQAEMEHVTDEAEISRLEASPRTHLLPTRAKTEPVFATPRSRTKNEVRPLCLHRPGVGRSDE